MSTPAAQPSFKSIGILTPEGIVRAGWFAGASREAVVEAVRSAARVAAGTEFHLASADGVVIAVDDSLPDGIELHLVTDETPDAEAKIEPVEMPGPKAYPLVGNLPELRHSDGPLAAIGEMQAKYGDFFTFQAAGRRLYFCADAEIISEVLADTETFPKLVEGRNGLADLARKSIGSGLFSSSDNDPLWHQAHRILMPAFGASALKNYYSRIVDVADEMFAHLDALAPGQSILVTDIMTRMTFEAIAYAAFNKKYHCMSSKEFPPFVQAMNVVLVDAMEESRRLLPDVFYREQRKVRAESDAVMKAEVSGIIVERRAAMERGEAVPTDLLQIMLTTPDRVTGLTLPDENIRQQLITFLIAGHETTSGLLSYAIYHLWKNPDVQAKLIAEADAVLGRDYSYSPTYEDIARLEYTQRVLKETLRLTPTIPMITRAITRNTTVGNGRYVVEAGTRIFFNLDALQKNPRFWGQSPLTFDPDRFLPEAEAARHPDAYHPFGMGVRACIGFQFALIEAKMVLARFAQRYVARAKDPHYVLRHHQALAVKPEHLDIVLDKRPEGKGRFPAKVAEPEKEAVTASAGDQRMAVLYGSNMGGSREIALRLSQEAAKHGFAATVAELDEQAEKPWLTEGPVVIVTSTYNGVPPDNAARFASYLEKAAAGTCAGVRYAVLGCGNKQWRRTFQKFPQTVAARLKELGAEPFLETGAADADGDFEAVVEAWTTSLWTALATGFAGGKNLQEADAAEATVRVEVVNFAGATAGATPPDRIKLDQESLLTVVAVNRELLAPGSTESTRHLEMPLPSTVKYTAGDHLGVFPTNPAALVEAVAARCGLTTATTVLLSPTHPGVGEAGGWPFGVPVSVGELLSEHVDLTGPVTRRELRAWAQTADCPPDKVKLDQWLGDFTKFIGEGRPDMMELLAKAPSVRIDLATLLTLRPPMKPRYYSISSSALAMAEACSLTVGVHRFRCTDGTLHEGLCSNYLARLAEGAPVRVVVKDTGSTFRLPQNAALPVILVGPGTGLAPLRGFLQERHALRAQGVTVGATILFFGCRDEGDYLYREELEGYLADGTLSLLEVAFSRKPDRPKTYVQALIKQQSAAVAEVIGAGGSVLVCGNARGMAPEVRAAIGEILGVGGVEALERENRYLQDVWAS